MLMQHLTALSLTPVLRMRVGELGPLRIQPPDDPVADFLDLVVDPQPLGLIACEPRRQGLQSTAERAPARG